MHESTRILLFFGKIYYQLFKNNQTKLKAEEPEQISGGNDKGLVYKVQSKHDLFTNKKIYILIAQKRSINLTKELIKRICIIN